MAEKIELNNPGEIPQSEATRKYLEKADLSPGLLTPGERERFSKLLLLQDRADFVDDQTLISDQEASELRGYLRKVWKA